MTHDDKILDDIHETLEYINQLTDKSYTVCNRADIVDLLSQGLDDQTRSGKPLLRYLKENLSNMDAEVSVFTEQLIMDGLLIKT